LRISKRFLSIGFATLAVLSFLNLSAHNQAFAAYESLLWSFGNGSDGQSPLAGLIMDNKGSLYGTTAGQGPFGGAPGPGGTVFKITPPSTAGGDWTESVLWSFGTGTDGSGPSASLIMDINGDLYGTTYRGGAYGAGTVFELTPTTGGSWTETILWSFGNGSDGGSPYSSLIMDTNGNLYGTTRAGGLMTTGLTEGGRCSS